MSGGGYDFEFTVTLPDRLVCKVCHLPSREPCLSLCCGHTFCKECSNSAWIATSACPMCRNDSFPIVHNKQSDREIKSLCILCTNKQKGCEWQGELNDINNHLGNSDGCQFEEARCSNECGKMIQRQYLTNHVETECPCRKVNCQYCHEIGERQFIEGQHKEECPKLPLPCPNKCKFAAILREDMEAHRSVCQLEIVNCLNKCGKLFERQCLMIHMETECLNRIVECLHCHTLGPHSQIKGPPHTKYCPKLPLPCPNKCEIGSVPREDIEAHRNECPLEMIQCEYYNVGCEVMMARKDQKKHDNEKMEEHLKFTKNDAFQAKRQVSIMKDHLCLLNKGLVKSTDDFVESLTVDHSTPDIPVVIRMPSFSEWKKTRRAWISPSFTAHLENKNLLFPDKISTMKMSLHVYGAGNSQGRGTHLSVYLYIVEGDNTFYKPPRNSFDIKLLNHTDSADHHTVTIRRRSSLLNKEVKVALWPACYGGKSQFLSLDSLKQNSPFLSDDCLHFQVAEHKKH